MNNQKGFIHILVIVAIVLIVLGGLFYVLKGKGISPLSNYSNPTAQPSSQSAEGSTSTTQVSVPAVNTPQDLTTVSNDLNNTNIGDLNTGLNQNTSDASNF